MQGKSKTIIKGGKGDHTLNYIDGLKDSKNIGFKHHTFGKECFQKITCKKLLKLVLWNIEMEMKH